MQKITIEELEKARKNYLRLCQVREEIELLYQERYNSYKSPSFETIHSRKNYTTSNPTEQAALDPAYERVIEKYWAAWDKHIEFQMYVTSRIDDPIIESAIECVYFCGMSWRERGLHGGKRKVIEYLRDNEERLNAA